MPCSFFFDRALAAEASAKDAHFSAKCPVDSTLALALSHAADLLQDPPLATSTPEGSLQLPTGEQPAGALPDCEGSPPHATESSSLAEGPESKSEGKVEGVSERTSRSDEGTAVGVAESEGHEARPQTSRTEGKGKETAAGKATGWNSGVSGRALSEQRRSFYSQPQRTGASSRGVAAPTESSTVQKQRPVNEKTEQVSGRIAPKVGVPGQKTSLEKRRDDSAGVGTRGASPKGQAPAKTGSRNEGVAHSGQDVKSSKVSERSARPVSQPLPRPKWVAPTVGGRKRCVGPEPRNASSGEHRKAAGSEKERAVAEVADLGGETKRNGGEGATAGGDRKVQVSNRNGKEEQKPGGRVGLGAGCGVSEKRKMVAERARPASTGNRVVGRTPTTGDPPGKAGVGFGRGFGSSAGRKTQGLSKSLDGSENKVTGKAPVKAASPRREFGSRTKALSDGLKRSGTAGSLAASLGSGRRALTPLEGKQRAIAGPKSAGVKNESGLPKGPLRKSPSAPSIIRTSEKAAGPSKVQQMAGIATVCKVRTENGAPRSSHVERTDSPAREPEIITAPVSRVLRSLARSLSERASEAGATFVYPDEWQGVTWPIDDVGACGACRLSLLERSPYCRAKNYAENDGTPDEVSMHSILVCGHFYHSECLERSVFGHGTTDGTCPRCLLPGL